MSGELARRRRPPGLCWPPFSADVNSSFSAGAWRFRALSLHASLLLHSPLYIVFLYGLLRLQSQHHITQSV